MDQQSYDDDDVSYEEQRLYVSGLGHTFESTKKTTRTKGNLAYWRNRRVTPDRRKEGKTRSS